MAESSEESMESHDDVQSNGSCTVEVVDQSAMGTATEGAVIGQEVALNPDDQASPAIDLRIDPVAIQFRTGHHSVQSANIHILTPEGMTDTLVYKVRTTNDKQYTVRPVFGYIRPRTGAHLTVMCQPTNEHRPSAVPRISLHYAPIPNGLAKGQRPSMIWQHDSAHFPRHRDTHRLDVNVVVTEHQLDLEQLSTANSAINAATVRSTDVINAATERSTATSTEGTSEEEALHTAHAIPFRVAFGSRSHKHGVGK